MSCTVGFIGVGNMAGAIISGITGVGLLPAARIGVFDANAAQCSPHLQRGCVGFLSIASLVAGCQYVFLSVKPQSFTDVMSAIRDAKPAESTVFVSIAAGIGIDYIKQALGYDARVIRVMPNTPLLIGSGATAICREAPVSDKDFAFAKKIFAGAGVVEEISSKQMNEVVPLNGSSPAYICLFAKIFVEQAVKAGFDSAVANRLFCETLIGSAKMMLASGKSPQELIDMVTSPKGTTFEGLQALKANGFEQALVACFDATVRRAYELGK